MVVGVLWGWGGVVCVCGCVCVGVVGVGVGVASVFPLWLDVCMVAYQKNNSSVCNKHNGHHFTHTDSPHHNHPTTHTIILGMRVIIVKPMCTIRPQPPNYTCSALSITIGDKVVGVAMCNSVIMLEVHVTHNMIIVFLKQGDLCGVCGFGGLGRRGEMVHVMVMACVFLYGCAYIHNTTHTQPHPPKTGLSPPTLTPTPHTLPPKTGLSLFHSQAMIRNSETL